MKAKRFILAVILVLVVAIGGVLAYHYATQDSIITPDEIDIENQKSAEDSADKLFDGFDAE